MARLYFQTVSFSIIQRDVIKIRGGIRIFVKQYRFGSL